MELLTVAAGRFRDEGLPVDVVSAGATSTSTITGSIQGVTEVQAGSYVLMDRYPRGARAGVRVRVDGGGDRDSACTAVLVVFDAGRKAIGTDFLTAGIARRSRRAGVHP